MVKVIEASASLALRERNVFSLVLSGGSTPKKAYELLALSPIDWSRVHLFWTDERAVAPDNADSNFRMVEQALLSEIKIPANHVHRIKAEFPSREAAALYEAEINSFFKEHGWVSRPSFDLVLLGIGVEGHTASLFPNSEPDSDPEVDSQNRVEAYWVDKLQSYRISMTPFLINQARAVVVIASGYGKSDILKKVLESECGKEKYPVQKIHPESRDFTWYVDTEAASQLETSDIRLQNEVT